MLQFPSVVLGGQESPALRLKQCGYCQNLSDVKVKNSSENKVFT